MVFACFLGGKAPQELIDATQSSFANPGVILAVFVRPSDATSPDVAPVNSW